jgi:hypothetical protein
MSVCKQEDEYIIDKPKWLAHLSNGEIIYQDDGREGEEPSQAWLRLSNYCEYNKLYIKNLTLQFRSHHEAPLPANAKGYYFINMITAVQGGPMFDFFIVGHMTEPNKVIAQYWKIPELLFCGEEERFVSITDPSLIINYGIESK